MAAPAVFASHGPQENFGNLTGRCNVVTIKIAVIMPREVKQYGQVALSSNNETEVRYKLKSKPKSEIVHVQRQRSAAFLFHATAARSAYVRKPQNEVGTPKSVDQRLLSTTSQPAPSVQNATSLPCHALKVRYPERTMPIKAREKSGKFGALFVTAGTAS